MSNALDNVSKLKEVTQTELDYLAGVTSDVQGQFDNLPDKDTVEVLTNKTISTATNTINTTPGDTGLTASELDAAFAEVLSRITTLEANMIQVGAVPMAGGIVPKLSSTSTSTTLVRQSASAVLSVEDQWEDLINITGSGYIEQLVVVKGAVATLTTFEVVIDGVAVTGEFSNASASGIYWSIVGTFHNNGTSQVHLPATAVEFKTSLSVRAKRAAGTNVSATAAYSIYRTS